VCGAHPTFFCGNDPDEIVNGTSHRASRNGKVSRRAGDSATQMVGKLRRTRDRQGLVKGEVGRFRWRGL
jgi:hypothetical protein